MQHHVHARQGGSGVVHLLPVESQVQPGAALRLIMRLEQQRAGAACRVVDALVGITGCTQLNDHRHDARHFRRGVKLPLAFAGLGGEMPHQKFVGIAQQVVALCAVAPEVHALEYGDQLGETINHGFRLAQLVLRIEVWKVFRAGQGGVGCCQPADDLVDLVADLLVALCRHHVGKAATGWHID